MIWWLAFEKKPSQFWQEIWIKVVVILLQLYKGFNLNSKFWNLRPFSKQSRLYFQEFERNHFYWFLWNIHSMKAIGKKVFREKLVQKNHNASWEIISPHFVRTQLDFCMNHVFPTIGACHLCITMPQSFCCWSISLIFGLSVIFFIKKTYHLIFLLFCKVHIIWEGHKILQNLDRRFVLCSNGQIYGGDFAKFCGFLRLYDF